MPEGNDEQRSDFEEAMSDVRRLEDREKQSEPTRPKTLRRRRRVASEGAPLEVERLGERIEGSAPGTDPAILRKLRNAEFPRDARVDLHGLHAPAARTRVRETLERVQAEGGRCVLVIHGRGKGSEGEPVLKESLIEWLAEPPLDQKVLAFTSATGGDGGVGATYVLLRRER